jgi:hypothetical protein
MIEAQIICCHPCDIPDLGIVGLKRGEQRWVSMAAAQTSADLRKEQGKGNVRVNRKARRLNANPRRPAPPFVAQSRPQNNERAENKVVEKRVETVVEKTIVQEVDTEKLKQELLGDLIPGIREAIAAEVGKVATQAAQAAPQPAPAPQAAIDPAQLEGVLENVLRRVGGSVGAPGAGGSSGGARRPSGPAEPVFIPNQIVAKDAKAKIDVKQQATEGGEDLDDAQAALRALKRQRRGKKNGNEENKS